VKPTFEELLAKYKKKGASQKQRSRPSKGKNSKLSPKNNQNIPCSYKSQENYVAAPYLYAGPTSPCPSHILAIIYFWIMLIYICGHICFNILLHM
jgi:hypothetical protein